jgi:hypothetical protein
LSTDLTTSLPSRSSSRFVSPWTLSPVTPHVLQSGSEYVFLKTASDRANYRMIMAAVTGVALVSIGYGLFSVASGKNKIQK